MKNVHQSMLAMAFLSSLWSSGPSDASAAVTVIRWIDDFSEGAQVLTTEREGHFVENFVPTTGIWAGGSRQLSLTVGANPDGEFVDWFVDPNLGRALLLFASGVASVAALDYSPSSGSVDLALGGAGRGIGLVFQTGMTPVRVSVYVEDYSGAWGETSGELVPGDQAAMLPFADFIGAADLDFSSVTRLCFTFEAVNGAPDLALIGLVIVPEPSAPLLASITLCFFLAMQRKSKIPGAAP